MNFVQRKKNLNKTMRIRATPIVRSCHQLNIIIMKEDLIIVFENAGVQIKSYLLAISARYVTHTFFKTNIYTPTPQFVEWY